MNKFKDESERIDVFQKTVADVIGLPDSKMTWLINKGFFTAPASTVYHGNYSGGLFDHSFTVMKNLERLTDGIGLKWQRHMISPIIVGMFHDLCKIDMYAPNYDQTGRIQSFYKEYPIITGHGSKSVMLLTQLLSLTEEEMFCIRFHMGVYEDEDKLKFGEAVEKYPNVLFTHTADMMAARIDKI